MTGGDTQWRTGPEVSGNWGSSGQLSQPDQRTTTEWTGVNPLTGSSLPPVVTLHWTQLATGKP